MATRKEHRKIARGFIATYDHEAADDYEQHLTRLAKNWLRLIGTYEPAQQMIDDMLAELSDEPPADYGVGWNELKAAFFAWAVDEEWIDPQPPEAASGE